MSQDKWISTDKRSNRLVIRFTVKNFTKQFYLATGLADTQKNRNIVRTRRDIIEQDIFTGRFDPTLEAYQFKTVNTQPVADLKKDKQSLTQLWEDFTAFKTAILEQTTILTNYRRTARYIAKLPTDKLEDAPKIRDWLLKNTTHFMAWELLVRFSECCNWAVDSGLIAANPFAKLKIKKPKKKSSYEEFAAYTLEQRDEIIKAFQSHIQFSHYAPLVKFLFWTGARPGEVFALTWGDIKNDCTRIEINKSCNAHRIKKGTKNGKRRVFPTAPGSKLQKLLLELKPPAGDFHPSNLIFTSITGRPMNSTILKTAWHGYTEGNAVKRFHQGVVSELAGLGKVPYLKPYSTRHTFATWAIAGGITPDRVALWIGDEVATVLKFYCHPNVVSSECPDF